MKFKSDLKRRIVFSRNISRKKEFFKSYLSNNGIKKGEIESFIDVKGMKSQGNQLTKLKVKDIELLHSIPGEEPWPEEYNVTNQEEEEFIETEDESTPSTPEEGPIEVVWDLEKPQKVKKPNPIKEDDDESELQGKLF